MKSNYNKLSNEILNCKLCSLSQTRTNAVVGGGVFGSDIMLIGEAPGADEDISGEPFVGRSGKLLMELLSEIGVSREKNLYITNTVKCRPPENRNPLKEETAVCKKYLDEQIDLHKPKIIILVGNFACKYFLGNKSQISKIHGEFIEYENMLLFPVYHPAAILRNINLKPIMRDDLQKLKNQLSKLFID